MKCFEKYKRKRLLKQASRMDRIVILCAPGEARKVGIIWHEKDLKGMQYLEEYFRNTKVIVRHLCFSEAKVPVDNNTITRKETNWLGFPVKGTTESFVQTGFDLLFNITTQPCFPLEVITALSAASYKIGWDFTKSGWFDLSVDVSGNPDSLYLAEQQIFYLQTFNNRS
jgi:hypothetical protein